MANPDMINTNVAIYLIIFNFIQLHVPLSQKFELMEERIKHSNNPYRDKEKLIQTNALKEQYLELNKVYVPKLININSRYAGPNGSHTVAVDDLPRYLSKYKTDFNKQISKLIIIF